MVATYATSRGAPLPRDVVFRVAVSCPLYTASREAILSAVCMPHMCQTMCSGHERVYVMSVCHMQVQSLQMISGQLHVFSPL